MSYRQLLLWCQRLAAHKEELFVEVPAPERQQWPTSPPRENYALFVTTKSECVAQNSSAEFVHARHNNLWTIDPRRSALRLLVYKHYTTNPDEDKYSSRKKKKKWT